MGVPQFEVQNREAKTEAAEAGKTDTFFKGIGAGTTVTTGSTKIESYHTNASGGVQVLEMFSGAIQGGNYSENVTFEPRVLDADDNVLAVFEANPGDMPIPMNPGVKIPDEGELKLQVANESGSDVIIAASFLIRKI